MKMSFTVIALTVTLFTTGCGREHTGGVAVVDLDRVAKALGRDAAILQQLKQQELDLNQKLSSVKTSFEKQLAETFEELPEEPSPEEAQKLLNMKRNATIRLASYQKQATTALAQMKSSAISEFRAEVMPLARRIAKDKGLSVVLTSNDAVVFTFDESVNITDEVIVELKKTAPQVGPVAAAEPRALQATPETASAAEHASPTPAAEATDGEESR